MCYLRGVFFYHAMKMWFLLNEALSAVIYYVFANTDFHFPMQNYIKRFPSISLSSLIHLCIRRKMVCKRQKHLIITNQTFTRTAVCNILHLFLWNMELFRKSFWLTWTLLLTSCTIWIQCQYSTVWNDKLPMLLSNLFFYVWQNMRLPPNQNFTNITWLSPAYIFPASIQIEAYTP